MIDILPEADWRINGERLRDHTMLTTPEIADDKADDKSDDKADDKSDDKADDKADDKSDDKSDDKADDKAKGQIILEYFFLPTKKFDKFLP